MQLTGFEKQGNISVQCRALVAAQGGWQRGNLRQNRGIQRCWGWVSSPGRGTLLTPLGCSPPWGQPCGIQAVPLAQHQDESFACELWAAPKSPSASTVGLVHEKPRPSAKRRYQLYCCDNGGQPCPAQASHRHPQKSHPDAEPLKSPPRRCFIGEQVGSGVSQGASPSAAPPAHGGAGGRRTVHRASHR